MNISFFCSIRGLENKGENENRYQNCFGALHTNYKRNVSLQVCATDYIITLQRNFYLLQRLHFAEECFCFVLLGIVFNVRGMCFCFCGKCNMQHLRKFSRVWFRPERNIASFLAYKELFPSTVDICIW